jgi:HSP20 family protein
MKNNNEITLRDGFLRPLFDDWFESYGTNLSMKTDIKEVGDNYQMDIDLPGVRKEDIKLSLDSGYLTIEAAVKEEKKEDDAHYIHRERVYGSASRSYYVGDVDQKKVSAKLNNGVLSITFPKESEKEEKANTIAIE